MKKKKTILQFIDKKKPRDNKFVLTIIENKRKILSFLFHLDGWNNKK